jgi:hypothetical protein
MFPEDVIMKQLLSFVKIFLSYANSYILPKNSSVLLKSLLSLTLIRFSFNKLLRSNTCT